MTFMLALMQLVCIIIIVIYEYKRRSPMIFCWATLLLMFGVMHFFTSLKEKCVYSDNVLNEASLFVISYCMIYLLTRVFFCKLFKQWLRGKEFSYIDNKKVSNIILIILSFSVFLYLSLMLYQSGSFSAISKDNVYRMMAQGSMFFLLSQYLYCSTAPLLLYCMYKGKWRTSIFIGMLILIKSFLSMSRMDMIVIFVSAISIVILNKKQQVIKMMLVLLILTFFSVYTVYALRAYRYGVMPTSLEEINLRIIRFIEEDNGVLALREGLYYFISHENNFMGFGTLSGYKRAVMLPIPSMLAFGSKPEDMCITMGRAWKPDYQRIIHYTFTPTLFGDCYANFGFLGCILGCFWGGVATVFDIICNRRFEIFRYLLYCMIAVQCVDIGRGSIYNSLCIVYYGSILIYIYISLGKRVKNIRIRLS